MGRDLEIWMGAGVFTVVGLLILLYGIVEWRQTWSWLRDAEQTTGTVVRLEERSNLTYHDAAEEHGQSSTWVLDAEFEANGERYEIRAGSMLLRWFFKVGDEVRIHYYPDAPGEGRLGFGFLLWGPAGFGLLLAFMFLGGGWLIFYSFG
ncbi:MAG: DUF3592 domain-containing protein [Gammaproteobacteria bacterium]|nr:DUF3592 domain-containing protein [Gammaproteobacteria bacterium]